MSSANLKSGPVPGKKQESMTGLRRYQRDVKSDLKTVRDEAKRLDEDKAPINTPHSWEHDSTASTAPRGWKEGAIQTGYDKATGQYYLLVNIGGVLRRATLI